jgi:hypothetical protein
VQKTIGAVPVFLVLDDSKGSRVILPFGVKVVLYLVPEGGTAVNGSPVSQKVSKRRSAILTSY